MAQPHETPRYALESAILAAELAHLPDDYHDQSSYKYPAYKMHMLAVIAAQQIYASSAISAADLVCRGGCAEYWQIMDNLRKEITTECSHDIWSMQDNTHDSAMPPAAENPSDLFISHYVSSLHHAITNYSRIAVQYVYHKRLLTRQLYCSPWLNLQLDHGYFATIPKDITNNYILPLMASRVITRIMDKSFVSDFTGNYYNHWCPVLVHQTRTKHCECTDHPIIYIVDERTIHTYCGVEVKKHETARVGGENHIISTDGYLVQLLNTDPEHEYTDGLFETCIFTGIESQINLKDLFAALPKHKVSFIGSMVHVTATDYYANHTPLGMEYKKINRDPKSQGMPTTTGSNLILYHVGDHVVSMDEAQGTIKIFIDGKEYTKIYSFCLPIMIDNSMYVLDRDGITQISFDFLVGE